MDKIALIDKTIEVLRKERASAEAGLASMRRGAKEAPSAMESHSDTTRSQMQHLSENLERDAEEKEEGIKALESLKLSMGTVPKSSVGIGSLADVAAENGARFSYFILPAGGSVKINDGKKKITAVSATAPLAKALIGKKVGETATLAAGKNLRNFKILDVS